MSGRTSRRGCVLGLLALALVIAVYSRRTMIRDAFDPSLGAFDARLIAELEQALAPGRSPPTQPSDMYPDLEHVVLDPEIDALEFARRCRGVPGWDAMVVVIPYGRGSDVDLDAAGIEGFWLRRRIGDIEGWMNEGIVVVTVIRDGSVVGSFYVFSEDGLPDSFAVRR